MKKRTSPFFKERGWIRSKGCTASMMITSNYTAVFGEFVESIIDKHTVFWLALDVIKKNIKRFLNKITSKC